MGFSYAHTFFPTSHSLRLILLLLLSIAKTSDFTEFLGKKVCRFWGRRKEGWGEHPSVIATKDEDEAEVLNAFFAYL